MNRNELVGFWDLVSNKTVWDNGATSFPFGTDAVGSLCYTQDGFVSVSLSRKKRKSVPLTPEELALMKFGIKRIRGRIAFLLAASQFFGYSGRYSVTGNTVVHHVKMCTFPGWEGKNLTRKIEVDGDELELSYYDKSRTSRLLWKRASSATDPGKEIPG